MRASRRICRKKKEKEKKNKKTILRKVYRRLICKHFGPQIFVGCSSVLILCPNFMSKQSVPQVRGGVSWI